MKVRRALFGNPDYRRLFVGQAGAIFGDSLYQVGFYWLARSVCVVERNRLARSPRRRRSSLRPWPWLWLRLRRRRRRLRLHEGSSRAVREPRLPPAVRGTGRRDLRRLALPSRFLLARV